jgi:hypothetical protein
MFSFQLTLMTILVQSKFYHQLQNIRDYIVVKLLNLEHNSLVLGVVRIFLVSLSFAKGISNDFASSKW